MYVLHLEKWGLISFTWYNCSDTKRLRLKKMIVGNGPPCMFGVLSVVAWARIFWKKNTSFPQINISNETGQCNFSGQRDNRTSSKSCHRTGQDVGRDNHYFSVKNRDAGMDWPTLFFIPMFFLEHLFLF